MLEKMKKLANNKRPVTPRRRSNPGNGKISRAIVRPLSSAAPSNTLNCNIKVLVRVRPLNQREQDENRGSIINVLDSFNLVFDPKEEEEPFFYQGVQQKCRDLLKKPKKNTPFTFDKVFGNNCSNFEIFMNSTKSFIDTLMEGSNCSVFAYGATGAGKTYTMIGNAENPGITYLTMKDLFKRIEDLNEEREFDLMVTYIEVYNELVKDLLNPGGPLTLREDSKYGVIISGLKAHKISNAEELFGLLERGNKKRTQHPTDSNAESSRSHAVFQVYIQMKMKTTKKVSRAKLSMIDLAGSERGSATGFAGARFKEGANINKSLLALGNCINSLADGLRHIPYRDSKLTRLIKDSLGGNCYTIMIANVSPSSLNFEDTYNTLKYANRAKHIKANVKKNIVNSDLHVDHYIKLVEDLQNENVSLKSENALLKQEVEGLRLQQGEPRDEESKNTSISSGQIDQLEKLQRENQELKTRIEMFCTSTPEISIISSGSLNDIDAKKLATFTSLIDQKKELMEREFQLRSSELGMNLRRELKTQIETRLSTLYYDTPTKEETRKKMNQQIDRYEKKMNCTANEIDENRSKQSKLDKDLGALAEDEPSLMEKYKIMEMEMEVLKLKYEMALALKEKTILLNNHQEKDSLIENMAALVTPLFMAVGGRNDAPQQIKQKYENLISIFDGKQGVKWVEDEEPEQTDSGLSSLTSIHQRLDQEDHRNAKRKIESDSQVSLDSTFTYNKSPHPKISSENKMSVKMVAKGHRSPMPKRLATGTTPKKLTRNKENVTKKPLDKFNRANTPSKGSKRLSARPRFKL